MKEIKKTITREEIAYYEAFDGTWFSHKDACEEYEATALAAARKTAWAYRIRCVDDYEFTMSVGLCGDDCIQVFDVPNAEALEIINHWMVLETCDGIVDPCYIGKRVLIADRYYDGNYCIGTYEEVLDRSVGTLNHIYRDKETK